MIIKGSTSNFISFSADIDLINDLQENAKKQLTDMGYKDLNPKDYLNTYFNVKKRKIIPTPRTIHKSDVFCCPRGYESPLKEIEKHITNGDDLTPYMSKSIDKGDFYDNIDKTNVFGIVVVFENAFIFKSRILTEVFKDLKIDSESAEATFIKSNIYVTDLSDIESFTSGSFNIFTALESKRNDSKRWGDMGLYSNELYDHAPTKSQSLISFENETRNILKRHLAKMIELRLLPVPTDTSSN